MSNSKKGEIASNLILLSPPCELPNVVRAIRQHSLDQFTAVKLPGSEYSSILCSFSDMGDGKYRDPRTGILYDYDYNTREATPVGKLAPDNQLGGSINLESWRHAFEKEITNYVKEHYHEGTVSVFAPSDKPRIVACIEAHYSKNTTTGRWRSEWTLNTESHPEGSLVQVSGLIRVQTHLYEEGNIQLISSKEITFEVNAKNPQLFAAECVKNINTQDDVYQVAIAQNFQTMSDTTLKALRRQLPVTKTKIDWNNINSYQIGNEMSKPVAN
ncbi:F-actin-capping protein [Cichlidogyrus casuarinus]|uniref:F-actin-capping protein subunit alpha n=1 Tax=Cichlidogyrus casuarinus TaxID=1844966 RepID=A0ABD2QNH1_9PLAT